MKNNLIAKSFLQSGRDLPVTDGVYCKHPTVQDIFDLDKERNGFYCENIYYGMIQLFLTDPYNYMVYLDDKHFDYEEVTPFQVFLMLFNDYQEKFKTIEDPEEAERRFRNNAYFKAFKFFFGIDHFYIAQVSSGDNILAYVDENSEPKFLMDDVGYNYVSEFIRKINGIPEDKDKINPEDDVAKMILIDDERERLKKLALKKDDDDEDKETSRLGNLLSSVTWACNGGITPFNRNQLHMYDLIDSIHRTDKLLNYQNTMTGLYSGCVDKKKIKWDELHWSN